MPPSHCTTSVWVADTALEDNPLHINQHGFQKGKSTESEKSNTIHKIERHIYLMANTAWEFS